MSSRIEDLHPCFQPIAAVILEECADHLGSGAPGGSVIRAAVTFRLLSEQAAAKAAGLSDVSLGWHQFGLAMDVAIIGPEGDYVTNGEDPRYRIFGEVVRAHGCIWGGDWAKPDWDHCEWHPGFILSHYVAWLDAHRIVTA